MESDYNVLGRFGKATGEEKKFADDWAYIQKSLLDLIPKQAGSGTPIKIKSGYEIMTLPKP